MRKAGRNVEGMNIAAAAMMAALLCILGPLTLPLGPLPISLCTLGINLAALFLEARQSTLCVTLYVLIGLAGIPVFSGFSSGIGQLMGPTGGYLIGYLLLVKVSSCILTRNKRRNTKIRFFALMSGTLCMYIPGVLWFMLQSKVGVWTSLFYGGLLFLPGDILKIFLAVGLEKEIRKRIG